MQTSLMFSCLSCPTRSDGPLDELTPELIAEISNARTTNLYKKGQVIFYEGNHPFGLYCVHQGKIKLYKYAPEGKEYIVRLARPGDMLGYRAFFSGESYSATAQVLEDSAVCFLDKNIFFDVLKREPSLGLKLLERMGRDLRCAEDKARDLAYKSSQERIVELLLALKEAYGEEQENGYIKLNIALSREELANMLGTTTETAVRLLAWLKQKKLISPSRKTIVIQNLEQLLEMVSEY